MYALQACVTIGLACLTALFVGTPFGPLILVCAAFTLGQAWFDFAQELQRMQMQSKGYGLLFFARALMGLILGTATLALTGSGLWLTVAVLTSFLLPPFPFVKGILRNLRYDGGLARRIVSYGSPLIVSTTLSTASMVGDRIVVAYFMDPASAGQYGPAVDIARQSIFVLVQGIALAGFPMAIRALEAGDLDGAKRQMRKNAELLLFIAVPATAGLILISDEVAGVLLGEEYRSAAQLLLPAAATASFVMCLRSLYFDQAIQLGKRTGLQIVTSGAIVIVFIAVSYVAIPRLGILGACLALLISQCTGALASWTLGRSCFPLPFPAGTLFRICLATLAMFFVVQIFKSSVILDDVTKLAIMIPMAALVYGSGVVAMNVLGLKTTIREKIKRRLA